jgi:hypothetical protein
MERKTKHTCVWIVRGVMLVRPIPMNLDGIRLPRIGDGSRRRKGELGTERQQRQERRAEGFPF